MGYRRALRAAAGLRHGVFTARMKRRAFQQAPSREPEADECTVITKGANRVVRAGRGETAAATRTEENGERGRKDTLINPYEYHQSGGGQANQT